AQLNYAIRVSSHVDHKWDSYVDAAADALLAARDKDGIITDEAAAHAETLLQPVSEECKKLTVHCIAHAHIDMNWMWGYQETAGLTIDTFRTILNLMKEYDQLTFGQSQASVYRIIEEHAPEMLAEIKERIDEGRWEVTATTWVETDKNMPSGEALARHILNTKTYMSKLFGLSSDQLPMDFEPDTFGHSARIPEICNAGGIKYYYHCRGHRPHSVYRWEGESGASLLVYCEPDWYNCEIRPDMFEELPGFVAKYGLTDVLKVYGVGDHGGGPTRRDVERLIDMATWPCFPTMIFSTYKACFDRLATQIDKFPVVTGEQNFIFTGCYTTQSRIKMANRVGEDRLYEAETLAAASKLFGGPNRADRLTKAWEPVLFNQFHDILPGSGVIDTREYAMGQFQRAMADANTSADEAMRYLASQIDTSHLPTDTDGGDVSEGGGVGFGLSQQEGYNFPQTERGRGKTRLFTLYNTTAHHRQGPVELTVWDWPGDTGRLAVTLPDGTALPVQVIKSGQHYWGHQYTTFLVDAFVPAFGYTTVILKEALPTLPPFRVLDHGRTHNHWDQPLVLENEQISAEFDRTTMQLVRLVDKKSGKTVVSAEKPSCYFNYILESPERGMTSWVVGPYMKVENLNVTRPVRVTNESVWGLNPSITYKLSFDRSDLSVTVSLPAHSSQLVYNIEVDWHETGNRNKGIPQLQFAVPFDFAAKHFTCDIPMGVVNRPALPHDVPCRSFSAARPDSIYAPAFQVIADSKYGFRNGESETDVTLIRAAFDPDPYPEYGKHNIKIAVGPVENTEAALTKQAALFAHPVRFTGNATHAGKLPLSAGLLKVCGENVVISAVKTPENGKEGVVVRLYNISYEENTATLSFALPVAKAYTTDLLEHAEEELPVSGSNVTLTLPSCGLATVRIVPER
ncbi:MAG TPA: alpha-mannosidase, partial [Clostridiales bacterium]|nr:alpha-mannosidase [Clostridiales bacterium]